jgi:hypothetical protein
MPIYFGPDVDVKICEFQVESDSSVKNSIFEKGIRPAFVKLIDSHLYLYGFYKIDDPDMLRNEALSNLYEVLPKFDSTKGKKAFSYFNVVLKNWFIWKIREKNRRLRQQSENFYGIDHDIVKSNPSMVLASHEDNIVAREFWLELFKDMERWRPLLKKKQEIQVLDAIVFLLQNPELVSIYNKKAVFLYIREMTDLTMKQVNHNMNRLKDMYVTFRGRFDNGEEEQEKE